jgi:hypothetical protein
MAKKVVIPAKRGNPGLTYVGPGYSKGIEVHGISGLLRPAHWTPAEAAEYLDRYPQLAKWFREEHTELDPTPEPHESGNPDAHV